MGFSKDILVNAFQYAEKATCNRLKVGAAVVKNGKVLGVGCNTSLPGKPTCEEAGCRMHNGSCVRTIHAEVKAIHIANALGESVEGCEVYCTDQPCADCLKYMSLKGIYRVYYARPYRHKYDVDTDIQLIHVDISSEL